MRSKTLKTKGWILFLLVIGVLFLRWREHAATSKDAKALAITPRALPKAALISDPTDMHMSSQAGAMPPQGASIVRPKRWLDFVASITLKDMVAHEQAAQRRVTLSQMPGIIARYKVSADRIKELEVLLLERERLGEDLSAIQKQHKDEGTSATVETFRIAERRRLDAKIADIIGAENMESLSEDVSRAESRLYLVEFLGEAYERGIAVSPEKENAISTLLNQAAVGDWRARMDAPPNMDTGLNDYDAQALALFKTELTQEQLDLFRKIKPESRAYSFASEVDPDHWSGFTLDM